LRIDYLAGWLLQVKQCFCHCLAHSCSLHQFHCGAGWSDPINVAGQAYIGGVLHDRHLNVTPIVDIGNDWLATFLFGVDGAG